MIDLTKPIEVSKHAGVESNDEGEVWPVMYFVPDHTKGSRQTSATGGSLLTYYTDTETTEAYRRLFEASPKMLAWMKKAIEGSWVHGSQQEFLDFAYEGRALIADIERKA